MKKYTKRIMIAFMLVIVILNSIIPNKYNVVKAINTEENTKIVKEEGIFHSEMINETRYFVQRFRLDITEKTGEHSISVKEAPEGTKIFDNENNEIDTLQSDFFKLAVIDRKIQQDFKCVINIDDKVYNFSKPTDKSSAIIKTMSSDGRIRPNVNVELKRGDNVERTGTTDENGECVFSNLHPGYYKAYEKDENGNEIKEGSILFDLLYNFSMNVPIVRNIQKNMNVVVENEKKKGIIEVAAVDIGNNEKPIENVEIEIYNFAEEVVETLKTNEEGIAISSRLPIDDIYKVKQKTVDEVYNMDISVKTVRFNENDETVSLKFVNSMKTNFIKITKVDKDNNDLKLEGVVFGIYSEENELIEEITTDSNGEAISSNLPINKKYNIREIKTLDNYVLDEKTITVLLKENNIETETTEIKRVSRHKNFLLIENQRIYNLLPKLGC